MASSQRPLHPTASVALKLRCHHQANRGLLSAKKSRLAANIAYRGGHLEELRRAARSANGLIRSHYGDFIREVGRNIYPLIVFTDAEADGPCGVGSTLTLYREDGSVTKVSPALQSNYELCKVCGHLMMGLSVEVGPYLANATLCCGNLVGDGSSGNGSNQEKLTGFARDVPWRTNLSRYLEGVRVYRQALARAVEAEAAAGANNPRASFCHEKGKRSNSNNMEIEEMEAVAETMEELQADTKEEKMGEESEESEHNSSYRLPQPEIRQAMFAVMTSVIDFCESCLSTGVINVQRWEELNKENFPHVSQCMKAAVKAQADACVRQIKQWRDIIGPEEWRELYVVIPTVWSVSAENPRKTLFRQFMDADRVDTHILTSEWPRDHGEARTLLGRVVGDRAIGRFVFGEETRERRFKTMGLGSEVDVVQDDALPAIWNAMARNGCPVRQNRSSAWNIFSSVEQCPGREIEQGIREGTSDLRPQCTATSL